MSDAPSVKLSNVTVQKSGSQDTVLSGVDWTIGPGEFWIVAARPGRGKSDLIATAAGLRRPADGCVTLFGRDLESSNEQELVEMRRKVGFVFENGGRLFNGLTALENILLPLVYNLRKPAEELRPIAEAALENVHLGEWGGRLVERIARPLHQRIALARALALEPDVLFLDNPLFTPDRREIHWWRDWLSQQEQILARPDRPSRSLVLATHEMREANAINARFAVIDDEGWHVLGGRDDLKTAPNATAQELLGDSR